MDNQGNKKDFGEAWNLTFFPQGKYREGNLEVAITLFLPSGEKAQFHARVTPRTNINSLAAAYVSQATNIIPNDEKPTPEPKATAKKTKEEAPPVETKKELVAIEHILYRNNEYIVTHLKSEDEDEYSIKNLHGATIKTSTIAGRGILKRYKNGEFKRMEEEE
jgi:hypothetical protein